jgi:hypothetical protein
VIFLRIKENELLLELNGLVIQTMLDHKVLERKELSHINLNKGRYEANQLHLTLVNSTFAIKELIKLNTRHFDGTPILTSHPFNVSLAQVKTIELSTRFHYEESTGFYKSQYTI